MERQRSIVEGNCLHQLFEAAADRAPGAVALVDGASEVTYAELERRTNQLARHLLRLGIGPEMLVGICTARTADMIVGMLGTLKAGAAYLSLDPSYPRERLAFMLEDAGSPVVLTEERLLGTLREPGSRPTIGSPVFVCLDRDAPALAAESPERPSEPNAAGPRSLAYAIYTSGSTGRPKGVAIEHRSAVALCHWARETFPSEDFAGMLASTSINFDLSVFEIFVPLAWGGTVILAENALALPRLPAAGKVTFVNTVPSAMAELLRAGGVPPSVRTVGLAGEPLKRVLADRIYARGTVHGVYNLYGPSEDTTYSTWVRVEPGDPEEPTIGRPVAGTELYLLDAAQQPAAPGEAGEVFLGGAGLARGYLGRPELTAERFLPDPFSGRPGSRLYRVGDLGRFRPDGEVQFLGRVDHQVKIRGFRIELGEIDAALSRHPEVAEAVVTAALAPGDEGDRRLVAYVEPQPGVSVSPSGLRSFLRERLPAHMVPSLFMILETLPRTPNGKVDRKALPEPDWTAAGSEEEAAAPRTPMEELVAGLWCEALGAARVGLHDHFLELGGHSLLAARLVSRLRDTLGVEVDLPTLFAHPTVAGFAAVLQRTAQARTGRTVELPPLLPVPRQEEIPASLTQARIWFLDQIQPGSPMSNVAIAAQLTGPLRAAVLEAALRDIVRRHEALRTAFDDAGGPVVQKITPRLGLDLPVIDLAALPAVHRDAETARLSAVRAAEPFDLRRGPLLRADLLWLGDEEHRLVLVMHHMTSDDWSVWVLFRELGSLYRALAAGLPHPLPDPPAVQYADFALWQSRWLATPGALDDFTAHARSLLADVPRSIDLPADRPHPPIQTFRGRRHHFSLPDVLAPGLRDLSRREGATLFMALLAAFEVQVGRLTGRERFLLGSPTANRGRTPLEGLIGAFADTAVWRADLSGSPGFRGLLHRVRDSVLAGSRFDAAPFELIPADLRPGGETGSTQFLQLIFALQTVPRPESELAPGLRVRTWELDTGTTKVDLSLFLWNDEGLTGAIEYSTDLFDESTIVRLADQYQRLLEGVLAAPDRPVTELDL
ncbi:MAG TPA: amino acid adenylation domain-containing protein, partial [Thermoanaerobaculia bacterium]|nr:amino acid adenylation domain-containing protein [Thermoanaerobaculia bacterium]